MLGDSGDRGDGEAIPSAFAFDAVVVRAVVDARTDPATEVFRKSRREKSFSDMGFRMAEFRMLNFESGGESQSFEIGQKTSGTW
jgi:hypothetical protein